jgi:undecaprenyl-diphosphatase
MPLLGKLRHSVVGREPLVFAAILAVVLFVWVVVKLSSEIREHEPIRLDAAILKALRQHDDPHRLRGPAWVESVVRDVTALGGVVVLALVVCAVCGFLLLINHKHMMWLVLASTLGATAINSTLKLVIDRPRPEVVPKLTDVRSESFPSGHSAMSAAVYLTLGGLLAQTVKQRRLKLYFMFVALLVAFLVGASRVALGVHYPSDVLAGWATGLAWSLLCWLAARYLQRRGAIEQEEEGPPPATRLSSPKSTTPESNTL